jgi:hypothetical protein
LDKTAIIDERIAGRPDFICLLPTGFLDAFLTYVIVFPAPLSDEQVAMITDFIQENVDTAFVARHAETDHVVSVSCTSTKHRGRVLAWLQHAFQPHAPFTAILVVRFDQGESSAQLIFIGTTPNTAELNEIKEELAKNPEILSVKSEARRDRLHLTFKTTPTTLEARADYYNDAMNTQSRFGSCVIAAPPAATLQENPTEDKSG